MKVINEHGGRERRNSTDAFSLKRDFKVNAVLARGGISYPGARCLRKPPVWAPAAHSTLPILTFCGWEHPWWRLETGSHAHLWIFLLFPQVSWVHLQYYCTYTTRTVLFTKCLEIYVFDYSIPGQGKGTLRPIWLQRRMVWWCWYCICWQQGCGKHLPSKISNSMLRVAGKQWWVML